MTKGLYTVEVAATFISGLGMMLLIVVSALVAFLAVSGYEPRNELGQSSQGTSIASSDTVNQISLAANSEGQVAGAVDEASVSEQQQRNQAAAWLLTVSDTVVYRDSILDRTAQNHARFIAQSCNTDHINNWDDALGTRIDEGFISRYSEAAFSTIGGVGLINQLPQQSDSYQRLFIDLPAYGVGVADLPAGVTCQNSGQSVLVFHLADYN